MLRPMPHLGGGPPIYVSIDIDATMDEVWRLTQDTDLHPRWDPPGRELPAVGAAPRTAW